MNQIINMVMRIIMRRVLSKGVDAGFKKASGLRNGRKAPPQGRIDDYGNMRAQNGPTPEQQRAQQEIRAARRARREKRGQA